MPHPLAAPAIGFLSRLRHPTLFRIVAVLMVLSWILPDPVPFLDEIITALLTLLLATWRKPSRAPADSHHEASRD